MATTPPKIAEPFCRGRTSETANFVERPSRAAAVPSAQLTTCRITRAEHGCPKSAPERHAVAERCAQNQLRDAANGADTNHQNLPERLLGSLRNGAVSSRCRWVRSPWRPTPFFLLLIVLEYETMVFEANVAHRRRGQPARDGPFGDRQIKARLYTVTLVRQSNKFVNTPYMGISSR